ncbi:serine hydrolase [Streptomyces sp. NPDC006393]|uniref:serine hydrolase n=1 Tax=Streptomyces sp. NPDC006393 TaxID=3156763 RepID=UPI0033EC6C0A
MSYLSYPRSPATAKTTAGRRGRRAAACAALLLSSATTLFSLGALHAPPAAAATGVPSGGTHAAAQPVSTARVTTAVLDLDAPGRTSTVYGEDVPYDTASIVKVDILAALLLQAQDAGRHLTAEERAQAEPMIRHSDNAAANTLWREIGRAPGLEAANKRLGLTSTKGGPGVKWGLTQTTARDQIRLLRAVFDDTTPSASTQALNGESRTYIRSLMSRVADDQAWGVSAAADSQWALKNGWLQRSTTGLWDVNSVGRVTANGHHYLVAVLSNGSASMSDGVSLVEKAARQALSSASP